MIVEGFSEAENKQNPEEPRVALAIFIARESIEVCIKTLTAAFKATPNNSIIELLVNGNAALASSLSRYVNQLIDVERSHEVRIWSLPLGDKANAWNIYFHQIWCNESLAFFIDGYVRLHTSSIRSLSAAVNSDLKALGGSGVPTMGRSSKNQRREMLAHGGFHGNLCCIKGSVIAELKARSIKIPLGLYRVDSLVGAILSFDLDPSGSSWEPKRIVVVESSSWDIDAKSIFRLRDWKGKINQIERQLRGKVENAAVKYIFTKLKFQPEQLPEEMRVVVDLWRKEDRDHYLQFMRRNPISAFVYRRHLSLAYDWSMRDIANLIR
ncbi:hypothetical protein [Acidovorax sp.]|uniref:hypothetical protein n=1 Tax=Acidovorax sp. TaxID=1872122 RepID=UPI0025BD30F7|nr:hypothetical protein [Acidovorax sp.]